MMSTPVDIDIFPQAGLTFVCGRLLSDTSISVLRGYIRSPVTTESETCHVTGGHRGTVVKGQVTGTKTGRRRDDRVGLLQTP
jgi:hypothetical protein